jgi:flavin reductase (DIM6/NTAB) family NADH-FMN oxidoreductase RutF
MVAVTGYYTINHINESIYKQAHQTSARYDKHISEFEAVGLEEDYSSSSKAPFVKEAVVKIGMQLEEIIPIPTNGTILIIGSIKQIEIDDSIVGTDGFVDLSSKDVLISQGLDAYFASKLIGRLPYAKP